MRKALLSLIIIFSSFVLSGQNKQSYDSLQISSNQRILNNLAGLPQGITLGGYGEVLYNKPENLNAEIDIQRLVLLFGYKFDERVQFVTEIEFEHVKEVYVEQAFVNYNLTQGLNIRAGLMLVPMGIINEFHEPTIFNGVERPSLDKYIIPTTWREIGIGLSGRLNRISSLGRNDLFNCVCRQLWVIDRGGSLDCRHGSVWPRKRHADQLAVRAPIKTTVREG